MTFKLLFDDQGVKPAQRSELLNLSSIHLLRLHLDGCHESFFDFDESNLSILDMLVMVPDSSYDVSIFSKLESFTLKFSFLELAKVLDALSLEIGSVASHLIIEPFAIVSVSILVFCQAKSMSLVVFPLSGVNASVSEVERSLSVALSLAEFSFVSSTGGELLLAISMRLVGQPGTIIPRA